MTKFGVTKPNKAYRRALEGTAHAPKKRRDPAEAYKTAKDSLAYAHKHEKNKSKAAHMKAALDSMDASERDDNEANAVAEMALRRV